jgi:intracellular septation protein A
VNIWTYRFKPVIDGHTVAVALEYGFTASRLVVHPAGDAAGVPVVDRLDFMNEAYRLQAVEIGSAGGPVQIIAGPRTWWSIGLKVVRNGQTLWQSHDNPHGYLTRMQALMNSRQTGSISGSAAQPAFDGGAWKRNGPSIACDIALGILFFVLGKTTDLRTAALVTAAVGLSLVPLQWLINRFAPKPIDLLGGLALFGVIMMLISAGFSWYFESEFAVQLKATVMGGIGATVFAVDALFGGRVMARRMATYLAYRDLNLRRLAVAMAGIGATMASVNLAVALNFSKDTWLYYTTWGDMVLVIVLTQYAINWARR